jgi:C4-dicarboxylate-specific signal transduction histidine kinase
MTDDRQMLAIGGVRFFGEMCASVSHEIKNVLAIINENAGLLQDMVRMIDKEIPLDPERLSGLAQSINRQVTRGDGIVKGLNRFAHSADEATEPVDVVALIQFVVNLAHRLIAMKGQAPRIETPVESMTAVTNRFFLENLVWDCLHRALNACPSNRAVSIRTDKIDGCVQIRFCGLNPQALADEAAHPMPGESAVARLLGARLTADREKCEIGIILSS